MAKQSLIFVGILALALLACSGPAGLGGGGKSKGDSTENKTPQDPKKPTDDTEGLPGYLTDPSIVIVHKNEDGRYKVSAPAGAVKSNEGEAKDVVIRIYQVEAEEFDSPREAKEGKVEVPAHYVAETSAEEDGSFAIDVDLDPGKVILLSLTPQGSDTAVAIPEGKGTVYGYVDLPFSELAPEDLKSDRREKISTKTETATDTSDDTDTETATQTTCAGKKLHDGCWYLSAAGGSCDEICAGHGGYDELTETATGVSGTLQACYDVLGALGVTGTQVGDVPHPLDIGCMANAANERYRWGSNPASSAEKYPTFRRACACKL